ncbi:methyl-accepting chemotaxis protein [Paenibacillus anaericanus]|uniref:methyl-accepting chemotaxis protein n=1 Tax=Paenibacillus anaericanus TaxID=170367 RepID=UPI00278449D6|nr:methyl-accepting chemotaxis protein [Paenibacillus anaericanus]MDQ0089695.1 methyl-accepting chemotaxis protein [Paenibacillus anaericanus]
MRRSSIATKISLIVIGIMLVFAAAIAIVAIEQMSKGIKTFAEEKAKSDLGLAGQFIDSKYPGAWMMQEGEMYKGNVKMSGNFELVDDIGEMTGDTVTIFQGDTRIATNVMIEGERAVGTTVSSAVAEAVLKNGQKYYGEAVVVGNTYQAAYEPIKDAGGEIIGIFYVGAPQGLINNIISSFMVRFLWVIVISILISFALIVLYINRMKKRLSTLSKAMESAGEGDFTTVVQDLGGDEIGKLALSFNRMGANLQDLVQHGLHASDNVSTTASQLRLIAEKTTEESTRIATSIEQVAVGADSQTQSAAENARAVEEIAYGVQSIAEHAVDVSEVMAQTQQHAQAGGQYVKKTVMQMATIDGSIRDTELIIRQLDEKSREITGMVMMIQGISQQTSLLALNASIEAARAGEEGRGFAVVASEVRKLAEQSHQASEVIGNLMSEVDIDVKSSLAAMVGVMQEVQTGLELTSMTEESFDGIIHSGAQMGGRVEHLAATAEQMSAGIEQISASVTMIAEIAQVTSSSSQQVVTATVKQLTAIEEMDSSSIALSTAAVELQTALRKFKV